MRGRECANRNPVSEHPQNDFYQTPKALTYELLKTGQLADCKTILECCSGYGAISNVLKDNGFEVTERDIIKGNDFLKDDYSNQSFDAIVSNPPFDKWNDFVLRAKRIKCKKIIFIGKLNYFGSHSRTELGIWDGLSDIYVFDRQVAYDREFREDGKMYCGSLITGWFVWKNNYKGDIKLHPIDVQKYIVHKSE